MMHAPVFEPVPDFLGAPIDPRFVIVEVRERPKVHSRSAALVWGARVVLGRDSYAGHGDTELEALRALVARTRDVAAPWTEGTSARVEVLVYTSHGAIAGRGMRVGSAIASVVDRLEERASER